MAREAPRSVAGRVVAITGGARGIGRATAQALIAEGAHVAIGDIDVLLAQRTAQELGAGTLGLALDVTEHASFDAFLTEVERTLGPLDVLVNNAGIMPIGPFVSETEVTAERIIDINVHGVINGCKLALERFLPRNHGHLVNVASVAGKLGFPGGATYSASKHAVVGLSEAIRGELRGTSIDITIVMPVVVNTELGSGLQRTRGIRKVEPEEVAAGIVEALQTGRVDVWVPRSVMGLVRSAALVPRSVGDAITRALKGDRVLVDPDRVERAGYEHRTADDAALKPAAPAAPSAGLDKSATQTTPAAPAAPATPATPATPAAPSARATQDQEAQPV
jgi:NAD(P)-dependent dehydrogenase (short-subunit alcohol dehydrogenase family)